MAVEDEDHQSPDGEGEGDAEEVPQQVAGEGHDLRDLRKEVIPKKERLMMLGAHPKKEYRTVVEVRPKRDLLMVQEVYPKKDHHTVTLERLMGEV